MTRIRKWSLATAALVTFILLASWFFLVSPKKSEAADIQARTQGQLSANDGLRTKLITLQQQSTKLADQQAKLAAIRQHLPGTVAEAALIRSLSEAATATKVSLTSLLPAEPAPVSVTASTGGATATVPSGTLMLVRVDISAQGSYYNLELFLNKIEQMQRSFLVTGFTLGGDSAKKANPGDINITIQGRAYYSPIDTTATTTPSTAATPAPSTATS